MYRSYFGDVALLADLCRQMLVFETVNDLAATLRAMLGEQQEWRVVRVKNGFEPELVSAGTPGFRHVVCNVELTQSGADGGPGWRHICEVQLLLRAFHVLRSDRGHARYVTFRSPPSSAPARPPLLAALAPAVSSPLLLCA